MSGIEIMAAAAVASAAVGGAAAIQQGNIAAATAEQGAMAAENDAKVGAQIRDFNIARVRDQTKRLLGEQRARAGASGVTVEGSPLLLMAEAAEESMLDEMSIKFATDSRSASLRSEAAFSRAQGRSAKTAGLSGAGAQLITGGSRVANVYGFSSGGGSPAVASYGPNNDIYSVGGF